MPVRDRLEAARGRAARRTRPAPRAVGRTSRPTIRPPLPRRPVRGRGPPQTVQGRGSHRRERPSAGTRPLRSTERDACRMHGMGTATAVEVAAGHSEQYRPLGGYLALIGAFNALAAAGLLAAGRAGKLPQSVRASDVALGAVATYKLSRLISRDRVTSAIRAPFTRFQEDAGHGEVEEAARGTGLRLAVGELLVCPYCVAQWVAGGFTLGYVFAPRTTRLLAGMWTAHAIADAAQLAYSAAEDATG